MSELSQQIVVKLSMNEMLLPAQAGFYRHVSAIRDGRSRGPHPDEGAWDDDIRGATAEYIVNRYFQTFWDGTIGRIDQADTADGWQVRSTIYMTGHLAIKKSDNPEHTFILVCGNKVDWKICGWIVARDGMQAQWWRDTGQYEKRPAYFVPQEALHPIATLKRAR